ncbi:unnamed protein product [Clavelina lepadiformis]|uniref:Uncharacterized protein n=1 Tax=Clavelina lepadiformis TaxID=159417 RepID=A0ABP0FSL8_CLALP
METEKPSPPSLLSKAYHDLASYIPASERPDVNKIIQIESNRHLNPSMTEWKGYRFTTPFNAEIVEWHYHNWDPSENDVLIASFPKTEFFC